MIYLDTSVLVPLFLPEPRSRDAEQALLQQEIVISDLAVAEFSSAIAMAVRIGRIAEDAGRTVLSSFDAWAKSHAFVAETSGQDYANATALIRRFHLALRTPDALHIAIATRLDAPLFTFDVKMTAAAASLGVRLVLAS